MAIDKLGSAAGLIAAMRAEMGQRTERPGDKSGKRASAEKSASTNRDVKVLRKQLTDLLKPIALDDPAAVRAVRPQVVRAILLWEFGAALREHPEWQAMLESISQTLEAHGPHESQFLKLISDLKR